MQAGEWLDVPSRDCMWLEVTSTNAGAKTFYRSLNYTQDACTLGNEVVRHPGGGGFQMVEVERCVMRKQLTTLARLRGGRSLGVARYHARAPAGSRAYVSRSTAHRCDCRSAAAATT